MVEHQTRRCICNWWTGTCLTNSRPSACPRVLRWSESLRGRGRCRVVGAGVWEAELPCAGRYGCGIDSPRSLVSLSRLSMVVSWRRYSLAKAACSARTRAVLRVSESDVGAWSPLWMVAEVAMARVTWPSLVEMLERPGRDAPLSQKVDEGPRVRRL
jgi:hypothetical protein